MLRPFDQRMELEYAILSTLEHRIPGHGCERVVVVGYAQDEVNELLRELVDAGFVHALGIKDNEAHYVPSESTEVGRASAGPSEPVTASSRAGAARAVGETVGEIV